VAGYVISEVTFLDEALALRDGALSRRLLFVDGVAPPAKS
jgi:hypothetical protein